MKNLIDNWMKEQIRITIEHYNQVSRGVLKIPLIFYKVYNQHKTIRKMRRKKVIKHKADKGVEVLCLKQKCRKRMSKMD